MGVDCWDFDLPLESYVVHGNPDYPRGIVSQREIAFKEINKVINHDHQHHRDVAVASDGSKFAITMNDGSIQIFDNEESGPVSSIILRDHECSVTALTFSSDGSMLLAGTADRSIRMWHVANAKDVHEIVKINQDSCVLSLGFGHIGHAFLAGLQDGLQEWEAKRFEELLRTHSSFKLPTFDKFSFISKYPSSKYL